MCVYLTVGLPPDANLDAVSRRLKRLSIGDGLYNALPFDWDEGLQLRPVIPPNGEPCHCGSYQSDAPWAQFIKETLTAHESSAVGFLVTWGGYPQPGPSLNDEDDDELHLREIVYRDATDATTQVLDEMEWRQLLVFI